MCDPSQAEGAEDASSKARQFFCTFKVLPRSAMVNMTVAKSGVRLAKDITLRAITRAGRPRGEVIVVTDDTVIEAGDL